MKKIILCLMFFTMFNGALNAVADESRPNKVTENNTQIKQFQVVVSFLLVSIIGHLAIFIAKNEPKATNKGMLCMAASFATGFALSKALSYCLASNNESSIVHSSLPCANATESTVSIEMNAKIK